VWYTGRFASAKPVEFCEPNESYHPDEPDKSDDSCEPNEPDASCESDDSCEPDEPDKLGQ
jgi:hypothetical protein